MRKILKIMMLISTISMAFALSQVFAASGENYVVTKEMVYESTRTVSLTSGFVEIFIGKDNFTQYQKDNEIIITPLPDEIREDEYGNKYAYFDLKGLRPKQKFKVTIKRNLTTSIYDVLIPERTDSVINDETKLFLDARENIESDEPELISKAKEITEGMTTDYKKAKEIFNYVNVNMTYDESSAYANKGALSAFKNMRGVCEEFATLYVAMCRAVDIPSRVVEGYKVSGDVIEISGETKAVRELVNHTWAEIYLDEFGWVPVEPTVIYTVNGERVAYMDSFCKLDGADYIALGIYNYEEANRTIKNVKETSYKESIMLNSEIPAEETNRFEDIADYAWAASDIQKLYSKGIVNGYSETEYGPQNNISRIEFICMFSRLLRYYETQESEEGLVYYYPDYDESHYSRVDYDYLMRCYQILKPSDISSAGFDVITDVFGVGKLDMNKKITRAEVVALMDIFLNDNNTQEVYFTDVGVFTKFKSSIEKAYSSGLINGYPDGSFKPNGLITRAEMAAILSRYIGGESYSIEL